MTNTETAAQLDLDKLEALARAATPGPWHAPGMGEIHMPSCDSIAQICFPHEHADDDEKFGTEADAAFIAAANPATILALIAQARAQPAAEVLIGGCPFCSKTGKCAPDCAHAPIALSVNSGEGAPTGYCSKLDSQCGDDSWAWCQSCPKRAQLAQQRQAAPLTNSQILDMTVHIRPDDYGIKQQVADDFEGYDLAIARAIESRLAAAPAAPHAQAEPVPEGDSFKPVYWFSVLARCARLLDIPTDEPIPSGVMRAVEKLVAAPAPQEAEQSDDRAWDSFIALGRENFQKAIAPQEAEQASASPAGVVWTIGNLLTMSDSDYPGMGSMFAQVWQGDDLIARVYGDSADEVRTRANQVAGSPTTTKG